MRGVVHASGLCPRMGPQACPRKADVPRPEESSGLMGHSDREEEGLTRHRGPAWTEGRLVCPGSRGLKRRQ